MSFYYKLHPEANLQKHGPKKQRNSDAGSDIPAYLPDGDITIPARGSAVIPTAITTEFPSEYVAIIKSRSGLSVRNNIEVGAGVVDSSYTGLIMIKLYNHGDIPFVVKDGMRIAQLLLLSIYNKPLEIKETELSVTDRGDLGFGSTGLF